MSEWGRRDVFWIDTTSYPFEPLIHGYHSLSPSPYYLDLEPVAMPGFATTPQVHRSGVMISK